jgi:type IV secretion system protein VirB11
LKDQLKEIQVYLDDPLTQDIIANSNGEIFQAKTGEKGLIKIGKLESGQIERIIDTVASFANKELKNLNSILECEIPHTGDRFQGLLPPVVSSPSFVIRCKPRYVFSLESYLNRNAITNAQHRALSDGLKTKKNIFVAGSTGSGKTTFINALTDTFKDSSERLVICEDTPELCLPNSISQKLLTSKEQSFNDLVRATLRLRPDRIVIGELRGKEAYEFLKAMNTGHQGGLSSIHANSALLALERFNSLCREAVNFHCRDLIGETIDVVAFMERSVNGPILKELVKVEGYNKISKQFELTPLIES